MLDCVRVINFCIIIIIIIIRLAHKHKAAGKKIEAKQCKRLQRCFIWCSLCSGWRPHSPFGEIIIIIIIIIIKSVPVCSYK